MTVTRDVIYDLLPLYFAAEVSPDTRALIEEFLETDRDFARMTARFRTLYEEHPPRALAETSETSAFTRARRLMERRSQSFGYAIGFSLGALFALGAHRVGVHPQRLRDAGAEPVGLYQHGDERRQVVDTSTFR